MGINSTPFGFAIIDNIVAAVERTCRVEREGRTERKREVQIDKRKQVQSSVYAKTESITPERQTGV